MAGKRGFFRTWTGATFHAGTFFAAPPEERSSWPPLAFALVIAAVSGPIGTLFDQLIAGQPAAIAGAAAGAQFVASPIRTLLGLCFSAGLGHLFLILVGGRTKPFRYTLDCVCYASAPSLFASIPIVGVFIALVWVLVSLSIGLAATHRTSGGKGVFGAVGPVISLVLFFLGLRVFVIEAFHIPAGSMAPTLVVGDHIFINKLVYRFGAPKRGDVVVFRYPEDPEKDLIKRVVAVGGDTVELRKHSIIVNGTAVQVERIGAVSYDDFDFEQREVRTHQADELRETIEGSRQSIYQEPSSRGLCRPPARFGCGEPALVPSNFVYVLGDNRDNSHDSRFWGPVPYDHIKGRAMFVWWSANPHLNAAWQFWRKVRWDRLIKPIE